MNVMSIEGDWLTGRYRVACDCGQYWRGQVTHEEAPGLSPALPIAEAAAHHGMTHLGHVLHVTFSRPFAAWLTEYWNRQALIESGGTHAGRLTADPLV